MYGTSFWGIFTSMANLSAQHSLPAILQKKIKFQGIASVFLILIFIKSDPCSSYILHIYYCVCQNSCRSKRYLCKFLILSLSKNICLYNNHNIFDINKMKEIHLNFNIIITSKSHLAPVHKLLDMLALKLEDCVTSFLEMFAFSVYSVVFLPM